MVVRRRTPPWPASTNVHERAGRERDADAAEYGPERVEIVRFLPPETSEASDLVVAAESVLSSFLRHDDICGGRTRTTERRIDVLRPAVELEDDPLIGEPEVDPTDEPGGVVERTLEDGPRSSDLIESNPGDRFPR